MRYGGHELVNMFTNIRPDQTFKASLDEVIENEGKALIKGIAVAKERPKVVLNIENIKLSSTGEELQGNCPYK